ncbi:PLP-dependent aminotransferase family protein [Micromonospora sp. LOL_021]|uniref:aminotransferase-like domain-containing protein n=1 Tax=Micromonospora sp. LOL_021 TaxID=3345417 RepID=UPI003A86582C
MTSPVSVGRELRLADLHPALTDPVMESAIFLNEVAARYPEAIPLAAGRPYDGFHDPAELTDLLVTYQRHLGEERGLSRAEITRQMFQYGRTAGHIHELVAQTLANDTGLRVAPESIVVLTGAQEGMLVTVRALAARPDDVILVPSPCYIGMLGAASLLGVPVVGIAEGPDGLTATDVVATARRVRAAGRRPRAVYVVPNFSNPSGHTMTRAERVALLAAAESEGLLIIEDDPYGFLADPAYREPPLKALDRSGVVIHIGTFAKTCFPGARVGYVVADQIVRGPDGSRSCLADQLALIRSMITVNTSSLAQAVIGGMLVRSGCRLDTANAERIRFYRANLATLLEGLEQQFGPERRRGVLSWNVPAGGFFVVLTVPFVADERLLTYCADRYGVLWTPMSYFYPDGGGGHQLRLSCSALAPDQIREGVRRLAQMVREQIIGPDVSAGGAPYRDPARRSGL